MSSEPMVNEGLLAGRVFFSPSYKPAPKGKAMITLQRVEVEAALGSTLTLLDGDGKSVTHPQTVSIDGGWFVLRFGWDSRDLYKVMGLTPVAKLRIRRDPDGAWAVYRVKLGLFVSFRAIADGSGKIPQLNKMGLVDLAQEFYEAMNRVKPPRAIGKVVRPSAEWYALLAFKEVSV